MPGQANSSLVVGVQSITITPAPSGGVGVYSATSSSSGFYAVVDSTLPYLWLPRAVCDVFETLFMLAYDADTGYYLVNATVLEHNRKQNGTISIQIGADVQTSVNSVSIELPYDAFDLGGVPPAWPNSTRYFPIRRAVDGVNIIGRTFLQESMLIVDYERRNFTIAPVDHSHPLPPPKLIAITGLRESTAGAKRSVALVVALPMALIVALVIFIIAWWHCYPRIAERRKESPLNVDTVKPQEIGSEVIRELESPQSPECNEKGIDQSLAKSGLAVGSHDEKVGQRVELPA
jgi:hypothetical protein